MPDILPTLAERFPMSASGFSMSENIFLNPGNCFLICRKCFLTSQTGFLMSRNAFKTPKIDRESKPNMQKRQDGAFVVFIPDFAVNQISKTFSNRVRFFAPLAVAGGGNARPLRPLLQQP
jgi:hypothetical protein